MCDSSPIHPRHPPAPLPTPAPNPQGDSDRLLVLAGPPAVHDPSEAMEYAARLAAVEAGMRVLVLRSAPPVFPHYAPHTLTDTANVGPRPSPMRLSRVGDTRPQNASSLPSGRSSPRIGTAPPPSPPFAHAVL